MDEAYKRLEYSWGGLLNAKKAELDNYFHHLEQDLRIVASSEKTKKALREFNAAWHSIAHDQTGKLQGSYITNNPHPEGQREKLNFAAHGGQYDNVHAKYHTWYRTFLSERGYADILFFNLDGDLIYSTVKKADFATNLRTGPYRDTDLGQAFRAGVNSSTPKTIHFFDFKAYAPSKGAPAGFMSIPVYSSREIIGVLVFQLSNKELNHIMAEKIGLGETGETLLVGSDFLLRNDSQFSKADDSLVVKLGNEAVKKALNGEQGVLRENSYRTIELEYITKPYDYKGAKFAIVALESMEEINGPIWDMRNRMIYISLGLLALIGLFAYFAANKITQPILEIVHNMKLLAQGDTSATIFGMDRNDEIGDIARAVQVFQNNDIERKRLEKKGVQEKQQEAMKQAHISGIIQEFRLKEDTIRQSLGEQTEKMKDTACKLNEVAVASEES